MEPMLWPGKHEIVDHLKLHHQGLDIWDALEAAERHLYEHTSLSAVVNHTHTHVDVLLPEPEEEEEEPVFATAIGTAINPKSLFIYAMDPLSVRVRFQAVVEAIRVWGLCGNVPSNTDLLQTANAIEQYITRGRVVDE